MKTQAVHCIAKTAPLLLCAPALWASPNALAGLEGLFFMVGTFMAIVALIMLLVAFKRKSNWARNLLALPAIIWVALATPTLWMWDFSGFVLVFLGVGMLFGMGLIGLYFRVFQWGHRRLALGIWVLIYCGSLVLNPAYFGFVGIQYEDNDPFNGQGVLVVDVVEAGYIYTEGNQQFRVDNHLVLADGRRIPGIFHGFRQGDRVLIEASSSPDYAFEVYKEIRLRERPIKPALSFPNNPWFMTQVPLNRMTSVAGWGHDFD